MKTCIILIAVCIAISSVMSDHCDNISCYHFGGLGFVMSRASDISVCGSDGVTYQHFCDFQKAHCRDHTLTFSKIGPCDVVNLN